MSRTIVQALRAPAAALMLLGSAAVASPAFADNDFVSLSGASITEGDSGQTNLTFTASVQNTVSVPVTMRFQAIANHTSTQAGDATAGAGCGGDVDFVAVDGTITIPQGGTQATANVPVCGDLAIEGTETFTVLVTNIAGAGTYCLEICAAHGTINDNDTAQPIPFAGQPSLSVNNDSVSEGDPLFRLPRALSFTVRLSAASSSTVTVDYNTGNKTAVGGSLCGLLGADFINRSGTLQFAPGETAKTVTVTVCGDFAPEANETMILRLSNAVGATISDSLGVGTILNDD
jgi:endoglucanase